MRNKITQYVLAALGCLPSFGVGGSEISASNNQFKAPRSRRKVRSAFRMRHHGYVGGVRFSRSKYNPVEEDRKHGLI